MQPPLTHLAADWKEMGGSQLHRVSNEVEGTLWGMMNVLMSASRRPVWTTGLSRPSARSLVEGLGALVETIRRVPVVSSTFDPGDKRLLKFSDEPLDDQPCWESNPFYFSF